MTVTRIADSMDIRAALAAEHSKQLTMKIVDYVGDDPKRFAELMRVFLSDEYRPVQRASWSVNYCVQKNPQLVKPYFSKLIALLERDDVHAGAHRNTLRMLQFVEVPRRWRGKLYDICVDFLDDPGRPIAVRVFALEVAARIAAGEKALVHELRLLVDKHLPHATAALKARARMVLA